MRRTQTLLLLTLSVTAVRSQVSQITLTKNSPPQVTGIATRVVGNAGFSTYNYWVIAVYPIGQSAPSGIRVTNAPDSLTVSNYITVSWQVMPGATTYTLLRTNSTTPPTGTATNAVATGLISPTANDTGTALTSFTVTTAPTATCVDSLDNLNYTQPRVTSTCYKQVPGLCFADGTCQTTAGGGSGGHVIQVDQVALAQRTNLNFEAGAGVLVTGTDSVSPSTTTITLGVDYQTSTLYGAYAALPVCAASIYGLLYYFEDSVYESARCTSTGWIFKVPGYTRMLSLPGAFTASGATATQSTANGGSLITYTSGAAFTYFNQTVADTLTLEALVECNWYYPGSDTSCAVAIGDGTNYNELSIGNVSGGGDIRIRCNPTFATIGYSAARSVLVLPVPRVWVKAVVDATNITWYVSPSGFYPVAATAVQTRAACSIGTVTNSRYSVYANGATNVGQSIIYFWKVN